MPTAAPMVQVQEPANLVGTRFGRYEVEARLASGGMAEVWQARLTGSAGFEKRVALKTLLPQLAGNEALVRLFVQEAATAAELSHPNVVQVYDFGCKDGRYFMAMEYVQGRTLRHLLQACLRAGAKHLPMWALLEVGLQVCDALGYIHAYHNLAGEPLGLVHRDVSPENIMVSYGGAVKLIDFGVAKVVEEAGRSGSDMAGKPRYMAPEQAMGLDLDGRADLFSLGVVLYECATGKRPFTGHDAVEILEAVVCGRAKPVLERNPQLAAELAATIEKAMATDRGRRHRDAQALRDELIRWSQRVGLNGLQHRLQPLMVALFTAEPDLPAALRKQRDPVSLADLLLDGDVAVPPPVPHRVDSGLLPLLDESALVPLESSVVFGGEVPTLPGDGEGEAAAPQPAAAPQTAGGPRSAAQAAAAAASANSRGAQANSRDAAQFSPGSAGPASAANSVARAASSAGGAARSASAAASSAPTGNRQPSGGFGGFPALGGWTAPAAAPGGTADKAAVPRKRLGAAGSMSSGEFAAVGTGTPSDFEILSNVRSQAPTWDLPPTARPRLEEPPVRSEHEAWRPLYRNEPEGSRSVEQGVGEKAVAPPASADELPGEAEALFEAGLLHYRRRDWKQALVAWEKACALMPEHRGWAFNLARARQRLAAEEEEGGGQAGG